MIDWDEAMQQLITSTPHDGQPAGDLVDVATLLHITPDELSAQMLTEVLDYLQGERDASKT